jgi:SAM-dependent methyltransferase
MAELYDLPELYDELYAGDHSRASYVAVASRGRSVLELACGTGRLTLPLAEAGLDVTALDLSPAMLATARKKPGADAITWVHADMTSFALGRTFDTIMLAHNSLLHLHSTSAIIACFECVRAHLAPNGRFVFDVFNPRIALLAQAPGTRTRFATLADGRVAELSTDYDAAAQVNRSTIFVGELEIPLHLRCIFPQELPLLVERAGLVLESRHGNFAGAPFEARSHHQVCTCARST